MAHWSNSSSICWPHILTHPHRPILSCTSPSAPPVGMANSCPLNSARLDRVQAAQKTASRAVLRHRDRIDVDMARNWSQWSWGRVFEKDCRKQSCTNDYKCIAWCCLHFFCCKLGWGLDSHTARNCDDDSLLGGARFLKESLSSKKAWQVWHPNNYSTC